MNISSITIETKKAIFCDTAAACVSHRVQHGLFTTRDKDRQKCPMASFYDSLFKKLKNGMVMPSTSNKLLTFKKKTRSKNFL